MSALRYHLLDVFTDRPFTGNQLAVFVDPPAELAVERMQAIARELQLSETVFCWSADGPWPTRIFTPEHELPFAGHPTVGTAVLLRQLGLVDRTVTLAEGVGPVPVEIDGAFARFTSARLPAPVDAVDPDALVRALGLEPGDLHRDLRAGGWSAGIPFAVIPLTSVDALERCRVDLAWWHDEVAHRGADQLYPIAPVDGIDGAEWRARMFAPGFGIAEDPATGSAATAVAGVLVAHASQSRLRDGWTIHQGIEMGRPSRIDVSVTLGNSELRAVHVGGDAVVVGEGVLHVE